ncbi:hypothetical protein Hanom_Chr03g00202491 [Helianthus anomalus]
MVATLRCCTCKFLPFSLIFSNSLLTCFLLFEQIANSILNSDELDRAVVALTVASRVAGHCAGYLECATHVEEVTHTHWGTRHCFVNEWVEDGLRQAEDNYDNLSLPILDQVTEALKHDDYVARLKAIFEPLEMVQLTDKDNEASEDGAE